MRACVIGGGLAGALLGWRLAQADGADGWEVDLLVGAATAADATAASGGAVRGYERDPTQRGLALASLVELLASPALRDWAGYTRVGSVYLSRDGTGFAGAVEEIEAALPGSAGLAGRDELAGRGFADLPAEVVAVVEREAGYTAPGRLRDAVLADCATRPRVRISPGPATAITRTGTGGIGCVVAGVTRRYDLVVIAAGAWTPGLLRASGLPAGGYRTKTIQYAVHDVDGWRPPHFVDEVSGLYGRPTAGGGLLLGLPTPHWDVDPDRPATTAALHEQAADLARRRFPRLTLGPARTRLGAVDCYTEPPILCLRPVGDPGDPLFTFSGGSGGAVKTALAASALAAAQLVRQPRTAPVPAGPGAGPPP